MIASLLGRAGGVNMFLRIYLGLARRWRIVDTPNARSSHVLPTPHGGGAPACWPSASAC